MKNCALVMTSYPARLRFVPRVFEAWSHSKEQPEKKVLYLSLKQYPNREYDIPLDILNELLKLNISIIYRGGQDERNFKSYYAGGDFPNWWLLQVDDDYLPDDGAFDRFYRLHKLHTNSFITCLDKPIIMGNGIFYNAGMLDYRYLSDMYKAVPFLLSDLQLSFWACYSKIDVLPMQPALERTVIEDANITNLGQEYGNGSYLHDFQDMLIREYPKEYEIAKAFAGEGAPWVKRRKKNIIHRILRKIWNKTSSFIK